MSGQFRRIYPGEQRIMLDGGLNNKFARSIIPDNESPACQNVTYENGAVGTREGVAKLNTAAIGSFVGDGLYTKREDTGSETMVAFAGGTMWQLAGTSFTTIGSAQSVFTAGQRVGTTQYQAHMFIGNGGVIPYKYNASVFTRHGVYPPTTTATVASQSTGGLTGEYRYKVTWVNTFAVEGDVGPVTATFTAAAALLRVTSIPVAPQSYGVGSRRLYRTVAGGTTFKRVTEIADNTTTTYDDNIADGSLGANAPTDNGVPPKYSVIVYHSNRLFMNDAANLNYLWYTELAEPYTVASTNFIKIGDDTADVIKGLSVYNDTIIVHCEKSLHMVYMPSTSPSDWQVIRTKSPYGSKSPFGYFDYNNKQMFPAMQNDQFVGFAALSGSALAPSASLLTVSTAGSDLQSDRIEPDMFLIPETYVPNISSIVFENRAYISISYGASQITNNRMYVADFSISDLSKKQELAWVPYTGLNAAQFTIYGGRLYYISSTATGFVYKMESGVYSDDGAAIDSYAWTKEYSGDGSEVNLSKDFRYANLLIEKAGAYFMNVTYRVDSDSGDGNTQQVDLDPEQSLWGSMVLGVDTWGGGNVQEDVRVYLGAARGKRIQFKFSNQNTAGQRFVVYGLNFAYNVKGYR